MARIAERTERDINYKKRFFVDNMYEDATTSPTPSPTPPAWWPIT